MILGVLMKASTQKVAQMEGEEHNRHRKEMTGIINRLYM